MGVGDLLSENRHGMIAAHIVFAEMHAPRRIDPDRQFAAIAIAGMRLAWELRRVCEVPLGSFGHFTHGLAADDPSMGIEGVMNPFVVSAQDSGRDARRSRSKAAGMKAAVDGGAHVADDVGSHAGYSPRVTIPKFARVCPTLRSGRTPATPISLDFGNTRVGLRA